jgi:outer membrane protein TolC
MRRIVWILFICSACAGNAQTLDDYLQQAAQNNPGLRSSYSEYEAALQRIAVAKGPNDPVFKVSAFGEMVQTRVGQQMAIFSIEQDFPWFGTLKARGDASALMAEASLKRFQDARNELFYKVKTAFYPIYESSQLIDLNARNLEILESYKTLATVRFRNGKAPMVDVIRIEILIDQVRTQVRTLEQKRRSLQAGFNALLNRDDEDPVVVPDTLILPDISVSVWKDSLQNNPRLAAEKMMTNAAEAQETVARKESMPMLGLGFNYILIDRRPDMDLTGNGKDAYMPMFSVSLPIYRKKYKAAIKEAELMQLYYRSSGQDELNRLRGDLAMTEYAMESAVEQHRSLYHHIGLVQQAIRLLLSAFESSEQDFEEVLSMQQELLMHESERVKVVTGAWMAVAKLEYLAATDILH